MSAETLIDTMKTESDFCSICLQTKAEVKLDPISTKMYHMFFIGLVKCAISKKANRKICMWCRRRVINALTLVETAQRTDRILTNITQLDKSHCQSNLRIVWDQIQAIKRTYSLTQNTSRVISCILPQHTETGLFVKSEHEDIISGEEKHADSLIKSEFDQIEYTKDTLDVEIDLTVKLESGVGISDKERNSHPNSTFNEGEVGNKEVIAPGMHNFLELGLRSEVNGEFNSELDIEEKTPYPTEVRKWNKPEAHVVTKKMMKEIELDETGHVEISKFEPVDADENQNLESEVVRENPGSELGEQIVNNGLQGGESYVELEDDLDTNSQTTYSSADASKHIRLLKLTEAQRLQELEEKRQEGRYHNAPFKCEPCATGYLFQNTYEVHMERHSENYGSHKCSICGVYVKNICSYRRHCLNHYERHKCTVCGFVFSSRQRALDHFRSQHANKRFKCEICMSEFRVGFKLKAHMKTVHNAERTLYPCPHCKQVLSTKLSYNLHMEQHNHSMPRPHHCEVCSRTFRTPSHLHEHQLLHSNEKECLCQHFSDGLESQCCVLSSCSNDASVRNAKSWAELKDKVCEVCGMGFSHRNTLNIHRRVHSTERPYRCTLCPDAFKHRSAFKLHRRVVHKIND